MLVVTAFAALVVSGCGGDGGAGQEDSVEDTTTTGDSGQMPVDALKRRWRSHSQRAEHLG